MPGYRSIPIVADEPPAAADCSGAESFALMVLGDSMAPEFVDGEVIVVEPEGLASDGSFVVAKVEGTGCCASSCAERTVGDSVP